MPQWFHGIPPRQSAHPESPWITAPPPEGTPAFRLNPLQNPQTYKAAEKESLFQTTIACCAVRLRCIPVPALFALSIPEAPRKYAASPQAIDFSACPPHIVRPSTPALCFQKRSCQGNVFCRNRFRKHIFQSLEQCAVSRHLSDAAGHSAFPIDKTFLSIHPLSPEAAYHTGGTLFPSALSCSGNHPAAAGSGHTSPDSFFPLTEYPALFPPA